MGWWHCVQRVAENPRAAAEIIMAQNVHSLKWAADRVHEFSGILANEHRLIPSRNSNAVAWSNFMNDRDDLVYFDQHYGEDGKEPYWAPGVWMCTSLVCFTNPPGPRAYFQALLRVVIADEDCEGPDPSHFEADLKLVGRRGLCWKLEATFRGRNTTALTELHEHLELGVESGHGEEERFDLVLNCDVYPEETRELFSKMATYLISKSMDTDDNSKQDQPSS